MAKGLGLTTAAGYILVDTTLESGIVHSRKNGQLTFFRA